MLPRPRGGILDRVRQAVIVMGGKTTATTGGSGGGGSPWGPEQRGSPDLKSVAALLRDGHPRAAKNVVIMAGAGISTASGIPDFRSPKTGLYANLEKYKLPYPEAIFDIDYFRDTPEPFFTLAKELYPGTFKPTRTHCFFNLLHSKGKLLRVFTQNIDTLERLAGLPAERIVEAHGSFAASRCIRCHTEVEPAWFKDKVMRGEVAYCPETACQRKTAGRKGGLVKPDIVFFGEGLPDRFFASLADLRKADLLVVLGTSLQVHPFASLVDRVRPDCPRVLINLERVGELASYQSYGGVGSGSGKGLDRLLGGMRGLMNESGFDFEGWTLPSGKGKENIRDVYYHGKCDDGVDEIAKALGWEAELTKLHEDVCRKIDNLNAPAQEAPGKLTVAPHDEDETLDVASQRAVSIANEAAVAHGNSIKGERTESDELTRKLGELKVSTQVEDGDRPEVNSVKKGAL